MRVAIASDLHLGITSPAAVRSLAASVAAGDPDAVVLAGDVAESPSLWLDCLRIFSGACDDSALLALPGNHDLWAREGSTSADLFGRLLPSLARDAGFAWLEGNPLVKGGAAVAGSLAWYDYSAAEPDLDLGPAWYAAHRHDLITDGEAMDPGFDDRAFAAERSRALLADLDALERDPAVSSVLVVTHVPLFEAQLARKPWDREWAVRTAFFGNLTLGAEVLRRPKVATVVSGHTHAGKRAAVYRKSGPPITALVVGSDFGRPACVTVEIGEVSGKPLRKRWWVRISIAFLVLGLVAYVARNFVVRKGLETAVTEVTGFPLEIDSFNLGIAELKVVVKGMHLRNPRGFPDPRCITIRRLVADVDLHSAFRDEFHAEAIDLDIDEIIVVKNAVGETNLDRLAALGGGGDEKEPAKEPAVKKAPAKERKWRCDRFHLRIPRVVFLDYTSLRQGKPKEEVYVLNVDETFHDLTEPDAIIRIIVLKVLAGTPIRLVNATVDTLAAGVSGVVGGVVKGVGGVVEGVGGFIGVGGKEEPKKEAPPPPPKKPAKKK